MEKNTRGARERIIKKAMELFYVQGLGNTGINQIIDESSVAKTTLYHHFSSKDDLIIETLMRYSDFLIGRIETAAQEASDLDDFLDRWVSQVRRDAAGGFFNGCPVAGAAFGVPMSSEKFRNAFAGVMRDWQDRISAIFNSMREQGHLDRGTDVLMLTRRIMQVYEGAFTMWRITGDTGYFDDLSILFPLLCKQGATDE